MSNKASHLLINEPPLQVLPSLAAKIGLNEAIILQQVHYWLIQKKAYERDGERWVYNSYEEWREQFPFWSAHTIQRAILKLEKNALIKAQRFDRQQGEMRKYYTINYDQLNRICEASKDDPSCQLGTMPSCQVGTMVAPSWHDGGAKLARSCKEHETNTETNTERGSAPRSFGAPNDDFAGPLPDNQLQAELCKICGVAPVNGSALKLERAALAIAAIGGSVDLLREYVNSESKHLFKIEFIASDFGAWLAARQRGRVSQGVETVTHYADGREKPKYLQGFVC